MSQLPQLPQLPKELAECYGAPYGPASCEHALSDLASRNVHAWCPDGVIDTSKVRRVSAISDIHGDAGWLLFGMQLAGLIVKKQTATRTTYKYVAEGNEDHALVICGDVADDMRGAETDDVRMEGFASERGTGTWNALAFISYLVARKNAKIVVVLGNHEIMNLMGESVVGYKRDATLRQEASREGWTGGMRALLAPVHVAVCAGNVLFMHAEPPIFEGGPSIEERMSVTAFTRSINAKAREEFAAQARFSPLVVASVWGRKLGIEVSPESCARYIKMFPGATLVRGHCPNRPDRIPRDALVFGTRSFGYNNKNGGAVYVASRRSDLQGSDQGSGYPGVVVSCGKGDSFAGSVFRIDCMGSLAFSDEERDRSVVTFVLGVDGSFTVECVVGRR
jgi:hypothetical protein